MCYFGVFGPKVASSSQNTRITTDGLGPGVPTGGSNSQSVCYLQHLKVAISSETTRITTHGSSPEGGQQQLKYANHDGWPEPGRAGGRLTFAIRVLFTALEGGQQQLKNANYDGGLVLMQGGGFAVWAPALGVGG